MTETQRAAMRQALDILDSEFSSVGGDICRWCDGRLLSKRHNCKLEQTITALRAALAEPEPEPVANIGSEWTPCVKLPITVHVRKQRQDETHVSTREGITPVRPDDLIMRGVAGEEYPIGRDLFNRTYRLGEASPPALKAECDALRDALTQYGWHQEGCPQYTRYTHPKLWPACTCGFDAAIDAAREAGK